MNKELFKAACSEQNQSINDVAKFLDISPQTVYVKLRTDGFTQKEIKALIGYLKIEDPVKVFFT